MSRLRPVEAGAKFQLESTKLEAKGVPLLRNDALRPADWPIMMSLACQTGTSPRGRRRRQLGTKVEVEVAARAGAGAELEAAGSELHPSDPTGLRLRNSTTG